MKVNSSTIGAMLFIALIITGSATAIADLSRIHNWNMDNDPGWTRNGEWEFGQPQGLGGSFGLPDPTSGHTGDNVMGMNLAGDYSVEIGGPYELIAGPIDCTGFVSSELHFQRWLNIDWQPWVYSWIHISYDGEKWSELWNNGNVNEITEDQWTKWTFDISSVADNQPTVYIKWSYQVSSAAWDYSGWNLDDVEIWARPIRCEGDTNQDQVVDIEDFSELLIQFGEVGIGLSADFNGDFNVDADDFSLLLINFGNDCNTDSIAASAVLQKPKGGVLNIANKDERPTGFTPAGAKQ
jgi:hypothetical protein